MSGLCLSSAGAGVAAAADPWCAQNNNMWRSNTDVLQCWPRSMVEAESVATQGTISRPGAKRAVQAAKRGLQRDAGSRRGRGGSRARGLVQGVTKPRDGGVAREGQRLRLGLS